jgi:hypothetical protein
MSTQSEIDRLMAEGTSPNIKNTYTYKSVNKTNQYDFMDDAYNGTGGFKDGTYLVPHSREMFYETRKDMAFYKNFIQPIVNAMITPVFNKPAPRKVDGSDYFEEFIDDCDNLGTKLQSFTEDVLTNARLHGFTFVVVDNFPKEAQPATQAEALEERVFPYVYNKKAQQLAGYRLDRFGNIIDITFTDDKIKVTIESKEQEVDSFIRYTADKTQIIYKNKEEWIVFASYEHGLGFVPVIPIYSVKRKQKNKLEVDAPLFDLARINHAIYNKDSEIREIERSQGFSILYMQTSNTGNITVGTNNVLFLPMETTIAPGFASPDPSIQKNLVDYNTNMREDLFRIAEQNGVTGVSSSKSGIAIQWDFFAHESVLKKTATIAQDVEEKIAWVFSEYTGESIDYEVKYPLTFQPNDKLTEIKITDMYLQMNPPPKAKAMAMEKITRLLFSEVDQDDVEDAVKEIESTQEDETQGLLNDKARKGSNLDKAGKIIDETLDADGNPIEETGAKE